jgi:hypothetical protein
MSRIIASARAPRVRERASRSCSLSCSNAGISAATPEIGRSLPLSTVCAVALSATDQGRADPASVGSPATDYVPNLHRYFCLCATRSKEREVRHGHDLCRRVPGTSCRLNRRNDRDSCVGPASASSRTRAHAGELGRANGTHTELHHRARARQGRERSWPRASSRACVERARHPIGSTKAGHGTGRVVNVNLRGSH